MTKTTTLFPPVSLTRGWEEPLAELVPSQWGLVHLFDLCLWFGHVDTAWALASHGVKGCTLEDHHLGASPTARDGQLILFCDCKGWETCSLCCWGFPLENGIWMKDWDVPFDYVADAACKAAKMPLVRSLLDISSRDETLPFAMSEAAAARLLDLAILCGNVEAAANLAKTCQARPLRRWKGSELKCRKSTVFAALWAGANFEGLHLGLICEEVPLLRAVALDFELEQWQQFGQFFPAGKNQWPTCDMELGDHFLEEEFDGKDCVSMLKIQNAFKAGWDLKRVWTAVRFEEFGHGFCAASLLDVAVLCGQPDCAGALGSAGVELKVDCLDLHREAFRRDGWFEAIRSGMWQGSTIWQVLSLGSASDCKSAAFAAAHAFLTESFQREGVEKGIALYQTLAKKFHPRGVPMALVRHILAFSMEASKILDQLDLWDEVRGWISSLEEAADFENKTSPVNLNVEEQTGMDVDGEPGTPSAELPPEPAEPTEADAKFMEDVTAVLRSDQNEPTLSSDGVCLFRLKSMATSAYVTGVLLDATGPFWKLHKRVLEAGCLVDPENPVKALFVPITEVAELEALTERGYELSKQKHILALQSDQDLITEALREIYWRYRPKIAGVVPGPETAAPGDVQADLEDMDDARLHFASQLRGRYRMLSLACLQNRSRRDLQDPHEDGSPIVLGVLWFDVLQALFEGHKEQAPGEPLGEVVPSQWGLVHLFDLCLWFGHVDTAWALASGGVKGCTLQSYHLGRLPDARGAEPDFEDCCCQGWKTCNDCCWAFPFENGVWMKDWDARLLDAIFAALMAAKTPLVKAILQISSCNEVLPFAMSKAWAARLLDIAMLCGNVKAAANLAKTFQARPLRRWRADELDEQRSALSAALCAGADLRHLWLGWDDGSGDLEVPLLKFVALDFGMEQWQQLEQVVPLDTSRWPTELVAAGGMFLLRKHPEEPPCGISIVRVQNAVRAAWDLTHVLIALMEDAEGGPFFFLASLLDLAILCGDSDCADALASVGVELSLECLHWLKRAFRGGGLENLRSTTLLSCGSASECKSAASAAARAYLMKSFKREGVEKGIVLYQVMADKFYPRDVPMLLVHHILGFSMEAPKILDQLDLWDDVRG
eukprot:s45_g38.t1